MIVHFWFMKKIILVTYHIASYFNFSWWWNAWNRPRFWANYVQSRRKSYYLQMANPCNPARKSPLPRPANLCTPLDNSMITWICQVELLGFASGVYGICQSDYKDLPIGANRICRLDWSFFAWNCGRWQRFDQNEKWKSEVTSWGWAVPSYTLATI